MRLFTGMFATGIAMLIAAGAAHAQDWTRLKPVTVALKANGVVEVVFDQQNQAYYFDMKATTGTYDPAAEREIGATWTQMLLNSCRTATPLWIQSNKEASGQRISGVAEGLAKPS